MNAAVPRRVIPGLDAVSAGPRSSGRTAVWTRRAAALPGRLRMVLLVAFAALGLWSAQLPPSDLAPAIALSYRAEHLKDAFRSGSPAAIQAAVQEVELLRRTYGTLDVQPLVDAMAIFARQLGEQGQAAKGLQVLQTLAAWAPRDPTLLGTRVILMRQQGLHGYLFSVVDLLQLTRIRLTHPGQQWLWAFQHLAWLDQTATLLLWGWTLTLALRYRRLFRYLWEEPLLRRRIDNRLVALLGALLVAWPVMLGMDPGVVAMLWLWLLAPFLLPPEFRITLFVLALQLAHPALRLAEPLVAGRPGASIVRLQMQPQPLPMDPRAWAALAPGDQTYLKGWHELQMQDWTQAEATFKSIIASHPDPGPVWNNLGVARYQIGDVAGAQACFERAAALLPASAEVLINQSVVAFKQMNSPLGTDKLTQAGRVDPDGYTRILAAQHALREQRTFAIPLPDSPQRTGAMAAGEPPPPSPVAGLEDPVLLFGLILPLAALLGVLLRVRGSLSQSHPSQCVRCGDPFHTTDSGDPAVCSRCHHLFILKDGLHGESRKKKVDEVAIFQRSQRWLHRFLLVLLPGADKCFIGDTASGFLEFGFFCCAAGIVLAMGRAVRYPGEILADPASTWLPLGLALLAVLFLRSWLKLLPRRS